MVSGSLVAIVTPMHPDGSARSAGTRKAASTGTSNRHGGDRHRRHHRRVADRRRRRALHADQDDGRSRGRARPGDRRDRRQLDDRSDRAHALREGSGRHRVPVGLAVLQQADAGRAVPAFPHDRRKRRAADDRLQRARSHGRRSRQRHGAAPRATCRASSASRMRRPTSFAMSTCVQRMPRAVRTFSLLSGNDDTALAYMLLGGDGVISVTANVAPKAMAEMCARRARRDLMTARAINDAVDAAAYQAVRRSQPDPGEVGVVTDGPDRHRASGCR